MASITRNTDKCETTAKGKSNLLDKRIIWSGNDTMLTLLF